jgi:hypothetical protein
MEHREPAATAAALERSATLPEGAEERYVGYGVMAAPFASGDLLAMRRFTVSSVGKAYTSVWHRTAAGEWTLYADVPPLLSCGRYIGSAVAHAVETNIHLSWPGPRRMELVVPAADLSWSIDLAQSAITRSMNALARSMTDRMWRDPRVLAMMARLAARMLHAGRLQLSGRLPNGQWFIANPKEMWLIGASRAVIAGRDLGELAPLAEQTRLGDFWIPQRALFAFARAFFEPLGARHALGAQTPSPAL